MACVTDHPGWNSGCCRTARNPKIRPRIIFLWCRLRCLCRWTKSEGLEPDADSSSNCSWCTCVCSAEALVSPLRGNRRSSTDDDFARFDVFSVLPQDEKSEAKTLSAKSSTTHLQVQGSSCPSEPNSSRYQSAEELSPAELDEPSSPAKVGLESYKCIEYSSGRVLPML
ncbi:unnamed protein product [Rodentolepis nana]|uniref:Uncharacterized protein n=1 Tax=Rodentolepis nana TaxID=102285 RepID=A0A0R3T2G8_RODNA|nr:unnamed protein product [Rodentolepis nana]